jgi:hypothetical protein
MKKKLFTVASILTVYSLCTLALSSLENRENSISKLTELELFAVSTSGHTNSELELKSGFRNPIPMPPDKPGRPAK